MRMSIGPCLLVVCASLACSLATGCAQNAIFELYVELPPMVSIEGGVATPARFARVHLLPGALSTDDSWEGPRSTIRALPASRGWMGLAIPRALAQVTDPVNVRIAFCETREQCESSDPNEWLGQYQLRYERAFYTGKVSCHAVPLPDRDLSDGLALPSTPLVIDACDVGGCVVAAPDTTGFCSDPGVPSTHFCALGRQGGENDDFCDQLRDSLELLP